MNETHDPALRSWIDSANEENSDFPVQNLPYGVFKRRETSEAVRVGVAIGDQIFDIAAANEAGLFDDESRKAAGACAHNSLNSLMALGLEHWSGLRRRLSEILRVDTPLAGESRGKAESCLVPIAEAELRLPARIGDYTDFYASVYHATNVGSMFRPDNPLLPNYKYVPIAYHGRASSVVVSGSEIRRPWGQTRPDDAVAPAYGPSRLLDYELEVGFFVGPGNPLGKPIPIGEAHRHIFGLCIVNDWSARDIQKWEYQPLGPFLAKSFATTVSPWVVTLEALEPYGVPCFARPDTDPQPLDYLSDPDDAARGGIDVTLEVFLETAQMREKSIEPVRLTKGNFKDMYWTIAQMLTHHSSNGCNLLPGDLLASGTVSGTEKDSRGCLLELTWRGEDPVQLPTGEERRFLDDGDQVIITAHCRRDGFARVGFGDCRGIVAR
jgi:fumarylacetoacetase